MDDFEIWLEESMGITKREFSKYDKETKNFLKKEFSECNDNREDSEAYK